MERRKGREEKNWIGGRKGRNEDKEKRVNEENRANGRK